MTDGPRLIEVDFPLEQASLDSVHEKNVRHGHISTLHIWPARRPLAACRAALIATLLPDPGDKAAREALKQRIGGRVVERTEKKDGKVKVVRETEGGVLRWGRENSPDLAYFREEIRKAYGGRAPRVLDPFAGGGAIPLEALRLGCETTAVDINPVAWLLLRCTLEYPQRLAGQMRELPRFILDDEVFLAEYLHTTGKPNKSGKARLPARQLSQRLEELRKGLFGPPKVGLAWHIRAWGLWVLRRVCDEVGRFYPKVDDQPTAAYLWARTVRCTACGAEVPLLKTKWLCKKENKRVLLTMTPREDGKGVVFGVEGDVPLPKGGARQRAEHDKKIGSGTMSRSGVKCPMPNCGVPMGMDYLRLEGQARPTRIGRVMTAVVVDGPAGKEHRSPTDEERQLAEEAAGELGRVFSEVPYGTPDEPLPQKEALGIRVPLYGFDRWSTLFTPRQLLALGAFVRHTRAAQEAMHKEGYSPEWVEALIVFLAVAVDRLADYNSTLCVPDPSPTQSGVCHTFTRFAFPANWDFIESVPIANYSGGYPGALEWIAKVCEHLDNMPTGGPARVIRRSAIGPSSDLFDLVLTDPPYYDAISYSDLMDFFHIWLRRTLAGLSPAIDRAFADALGPKWDHEQNDGELIDDASRFSNDAEKSKQVYEEGTCRAFRACCQALRPEGRMVVVFANKNPAAWEALVSAIIRAGFVVDGSWPIQTERTARIRAYASAALSSSVWLVCRKRPAAARPGFDSDVLGEMRRNINSRLRTYWDAGIRGPDFIWAATGPALEAFSKHPAVRKADKQNELMTVGDFLRAVRRIVADFVVGRVLPGQGSEATGLDDVTTYYLLHRHAFGLAEVPVGASILFAVSCGLRDQDLVDRFDLLTRSGRTADEAVEGGDEEGDEETSGGSKSKVRLKAWSQRTRKALGEPADGQPPALIDQVHKLMQLWHQGEQQKLNDYLDQHQLRRSPLFQQVLQALIELARPRGAVEGDEGEVTLMERLIKHVRALGVEQPEPPLLPFDEGVFPRREESAD